VQNQMAFSEPLQKLASPQPLVPQKPDNDFDIFPHNDDIPF